MPARRAKSAQQARERLKPIQRGTAKPLHGLCHARSRFAKLRGIADLPGNAQTRRGAASGFTKSIKLRKRPEPMFIAGFSIQQWLAESTFLHVQPSHLKKEAKEHASWIDRLLGLFFFAVHLRLILVFFAFRLLAM